MADQEKLARNITLPLLLFYGLGNILGAGIYVLIGEVARMAGMYAPVSFLVALMIVSFTAMSYSELVSRYPDAAGVALYVKEGFRSVPFSVIVGMTIALAALISAATIARGFAGYLTELADIPETVALAGLIVALGAVALWGIGQSVLFASLLTLIEIGGLLLILWVGLPALGDLPERLPDMIPPFQWEAWHAVALGGFLACYAFLGFEDMVNIAEEVREPARTFPRAIMLSLVVATLLYMGVSLVSILILPPDVLAQSAAPFADIYREATGRDASFIAYIGIFAIINGALIQIIMASRMLYGIAKHGWLPHVFAYVHPKTRTPVTATIAVVAVTVGFALWLPIVTLANLTSGLILVVFTVVNAALVRIKRRDPHPEGIRTVSIWFPVTGIFLNLIFLAVQLSSS